MIKGHIDQNYRRNHKEIMFIDELLRYELTTLFQDNNIRSSEMKKISTVRWLETCSSSALVTCVFKPLSAEKSLKPDFIWIMEKKDWLCLMCYISYLHWYLILGNFCVVFPILIIISQWLFFLKILILIHSLLFNQIYYSL